MRLSLAVVCSAVILTGCATGGVDIQLPKHDQPQSLGEALAYLKADALIDLDAAVAIAVAHNDVIAQACLPVLKKYIVPAAGAAPADKVTGVISGYEKARVERLALEGAIGKGVIPDDLKLGCAALLIDERNFYLRLAVLIGGAAVPGAGAIAPFLPK